MQPCAVELSGRFGPALALLLAAWLLPAGIGLAATVNKCTVNGAVTYQQGPCPATEARQAPTAQQLNAQRRQRQAQAAAAAASTGPVGAGAITASPPPRFAEQPAPATATLPSAKAMHRCDGRTHCSQMTSCDEAQYFLAHCPGVKMDGNHDGVPCEMQWCQGQGADSQHSERGSGRARHRH